MPQEAAAIPHAGGRPRKLNVARQETLTLALVNGATYELAAKYAGISYPTLRRWLVRGGNEPESDYGQFTQAVKRAEAEAALAALAKITGAAQNGDWRAAAWLLEHRYPQQYGRVRVEITGQDDTPVQVQAVPREPEPDRIAEILAVLCDMGVLTMAR